MTTLNCQDGPWLFELGRKKFARAFFWSEPRSENIVIGFANHANNSADPRPSTGLPLFGGLAFDSSYDSNHDSSYDSSHDSSDEWRDFGSGSMWAAQIQVNLHPDSYEVTCPSVTDPSQPTQQSEMLSYADETATTPWQSQWQSLMDSYRINKKQNTPNSIATELDSALLTVTSSSNLSEWTHMLQQAFAVMDESELRKIVLARRLKIEAPVAFAIPEVLTYLRKTYPTAFVFAFSIHGRCFLGATPERLMKLTGRELETMGLAGTARRGRDPEEDAKLGEALLASQKDLDEHAFVTAMLREILTENCDSLDISKHPQLMKLNNVQHLYTPVRGHLKEHCTLLELVHQLHPTPAVGGDPRALALEWIRKLENFNRGWYAGPIGHIDRHGSGDFAVALRCALIDDKTAYLYAGCGIVRDSIPDLEFRETELKFQAMLKALGIQSLTQ